MIYDYLYYRLYHASHSKSFDSPLIFRVVSIISLLVTLNVLTLYFLMKKISFARSNFLPDYHGMILTLLTLFILLMTWIYFKSRHTIIVDKYATQEQRNGFLSHPALVMLLYCGSSLGLFLFAATLANN